MIEKEKLNHGIKPFFTGFFAGVFILFLFYHLYFHTSEKDFTFLHLSDLHSKSLFFYLIDLFPLAGGIIALNISMKKRKIRDELKTIIGNEKKDTNKAIKFLESLKSGRLNEAFETKNDNELLSSLEELRHILKKNREAEDRIKKEDNQRSWASEGLAMFGELLHQPGDQMEDFAYLLISKLVKYLEANQGGFFSIEDDEKSRKYIKMLACHAYDRRKFANRTIDWGTGLIGTCILEKKTVYMTSIPDNYLLITSGLGKATPQYLLLVPMISGEDIFGVLELASFKKIEEYQVAFCEKIAESIAITISGIKSNIRTTLLLKETRAQAEELALQEEKMRINMEELKATQEQAARQAEKFISFTNSVNHTMIRAEYDTDGILLYANTKFLKKMGFSSNREVEGKHITSFIHDKDRHWFNSIWEGLAKGGEHFEGYMKHITKQGQDMWTMATYTCVRKEDSLPEKVLFLAIDTTEYKKQSLDFEGQIEAINKLNLKAEFSPDGKLINNNELFSNTLKYPLPELQIKSIFDFIDRKELESFNEIWEEVIKRNAYQGQVKLITKFDEEKWFRATFTSVNDMYGEVAKVVFLANEITNEKMMEQDSRKQTEQMKIQEEKLRLTSLELERKLKENLENWSSDLKKTKEKLSFSENLLDNVDSIVIAVDNSGILVYLNEQACKYWKIKSRDVIGHPALLIFDPANKKYPEFIRNLADPAKLKKEEKEPVIIPGADNNNDTFKTKLKTFEQNGIIIYTAYLSKI